MITISATEARNNIGKLWEKAAKGPVTIESAGKPIAVVLDAESYKQLKMVRAPRKAGCGRHLLSDKGISVNDLLATPLEDVFSEYISS